MLCLCSHIHWRLFISCTDGEGPKKRWSSTRRQVTISLTLSCVWFSPVSALEVSFLSSHSCTVCKVNGSRGLEGKSELRATRTHLNCFLKMFTAAGSWRKVSTCSLASLGNLWVFPLSHIIAANPDATCRMHHAEVFSLMWSEAWAVPFLGFGCSQSKWKNDMNPLPPHEKCSKLIWCN